MKKIQYLLTLSFLLVLLPAALWGGDDEKTVTKTFNVTVDIDGEEDMGELANQGFLGVSVEPIDKSLSMHLPIPRGVGLVVRYVVPESAAAKAEIEKHDILLKLGDQLLISPKQLQVLVTNKEPGETIELTLLRKGEEINIDVELGSKKDQAMQRRIRREIIAPDVPHGSHGYYFNTPDGEDQHTIVTQILAGEEGENIELIVNGEKTMVMNLAELTEGMDDIKQNLTFINDEGLEWHTSDVIADKGKARTTIIKMQNSNMVYTDDEGTLKLTVKEGRKHLEATDKDGNEIFNGMIDTDEERAQIPESVLPRLEKIESNHNLNFDNMDNVEEKDIKIVIPKGKDFTSEVPLSDDGLTT